MTKAFKFLPLFALLFFYACSDSGKVEVQDTSELHQATAEEVESLIEQFILVEEGGTIDIPAGFYEIESQLIIDDIDNVTIKGAGMDNTILSFKKLLAGGEGMKIVGDNIVLKDFAVFDAPGDGIKTQHCNNITFRRLNCTWTNGDKSKNGTYAIYPVQCTNVMIDECTASHSRDAGIYVGQSENVIVKNCIAFGNVAGIEIENCDNSEVYNNKAYDNTGGILVFNLPGLPKADGKGCKIYNNEIIENNHENFAIIQGNNGNAITQVPPGTGIIVLAAKDVEVYGNKILRNKTTGIAVASYHITGFSTEAPNWSPFTYDVYIHDNEYERPAALPDLTKELGQLISAKNAHGIGKSQDIIYDGIMDDAIGTDIATNPMGLCIQEEEMADLHFTFWELSENISEIVAFKDYSHFDCTLEIVTDLEGVVNL